MDKIVNVSLDEEFISLFYSITGNKYNLEKVDLKELKSQLINILDYFKEIKGSKDTNSPNTKKIFNFKEQEEVSTNPAILVIDDLGVIIYQLKNLFANFDYDIDCSQEIYDAINKFKKRKYDYVVMDLFIPTEREGFILLDELKKLSNAMGYNTVIGVMTAAIQKNIEITCKNKGCDFFIEKNNDWQKNLLKIMNDYINIDNNNDDGEY